MIKPIHRIVAGLLLVFTFTGPLLAKDAPEVNPSELKPSSQHLQATALVTHFLSEYHYKKSTLDDALSKMIFEGYLKQLDPNRSYFLATDVENISAYEDRLDDYIRNVKLQPAFSIFRLFRTRLENQTRYAISLLDNEFDFSVEEEYVFDRSEADWAPDQAALNTIWQKRVKNDVLSLKLAGKSIDEIPDTLRKRYERRLRGVTQLKADDVFQIFLNAYTGAIEPHTSYFSPRSSENFQIHLSLSLEGIGAALKTENEYTVIQRIIAGGPAEMSEALHPQDRITGVAQGQDGPMVDVIAWRLEDVVDKIRGPKGTVVRLEIMGKDNTVTDPRREVSLVRDTIKLEEQAAKKSIIEQTVNDKILRLGVIELPTYYMDSQAMLKGDKNYRSTSRDVARLIDELEQEGIDGLVIDLRNNGGGALTEAVNMTGLFIKQGPVVQVRDSNGNTKLEQDTDAAVHYSGPLAVLVNRLSASASEIFSAAIQDYQRGIVIGEPTFGKGTVQSLVDLNRFVRKRQGDLGQLKTTVAQFFRVNGDSTQHRGVTPDILFPIPESHEEFGESALENALPWARVDAADFTLSAKTPYPVNEIRKRFQQRAKENPGFTYLNETAEAANHSRKRTTASLLEKQRIAEQEQKKQEQLERKNRLRVSLGLPEEKEEASAKEDEAEEKDDKDELPGDVWLNETGRILADMIELQMAGSVAANHSAK